MSLPEIIKVLQNVRADYVATCRDCHGLRKLKREFKPEEIYQLPQLDEAIRQLIIANSAIDSTSLKPLEAHT